MQEMLKRFKSGETEICRADFEFLPLPFDVTNLTDNKMTQIANLIEIGYQQRTGGICDLDKKSEIWWEEFEAVANHFNIPYLDDYTDEEYQEYLKRRE